MSKNLDVQQENHIERILDDLARVSEDVRYHQETADVLAADRDRLIREAREAGARINAITDTTGVHRSRVYQILDQA